MEEKLDEIIHRLDRLERLILDSSPSFGKSFSISLLADMVAEIINRNNR